jgi:CRP-like cAMP-binding protein
VPAGEYRELDAGDTLVRSGSRSERFFVVMSGQLEVERAGTRIGTLGPGDFCGETGLLLGIPRTATIRALEPTRVWYAYQQEFHQHIAPRLLSNRRSSKVVLQRIVNMYDDRLETAA